MKLSQIQQELKAPKDLFNAFGKYKYRSAESILEAVKPLLGDCVLTVTDEVVEVGTRIYVKALAVFRDGEDVVTVSAYAREPESKKGMDESQITGAASSYARKYALNGLFLIDDTKDADATNDHKSPSAKQITELENLLKSSTLDQDMREKVAKRIESIENMDGYDGAKKYLLRFQRPTEALDAKQPEPIKGDEPKKELFDGN